MFISNEQIPVDVNNLMPAIKLFPNKYRDEIPCRDPFILLYGDHYYLYRSNDKSIECLVSTDLENWSDPVTVFQPPKDFHGIKDLFWAPECHYYCGNFYIFTSVFSKNTNHRRISVYRSISPLGPFEDIANGGITPAEWDTIDGTFYVDENGQPWMVYVHEWTSMPDLNGSMLAQKLSQDLTHFIDEPRHLFFAKDAAWAVRGVTDAPFLVRTEEGKLFMTWSNFGKEEYAIGALVSESGLVTGPWKHLPSLVYERGMRKDFVFDAGHMMAFRSKDGTIKAVFHAPNRTIGVIKEHVVIADVSYTKDGPVLGKLM